MSKSTTIELGDYFDKFIEQQIAEGRYKSADEVVRTGLRLVEEQEVKLEMLRKALAEGELSGLATPLDFEEFIARKNAAAERTS